MLESGDFNIENSNHCNVEHNKQQHEQHNEDQQYNKDGSQLQEENETARDYDSDEIVCNYDPNDDEFLVGDACSVEGDRFINPNNYSLVDPSNYIINDYENTDLGGDFIHNYITEGAGTYEVESSRCDSHQHREDSNQDSEVSNTGNRLTIITALSSLIQYGTSKAITGIRHSSTALNKATRTTIQILSHSLDKVTRTTTQMIKNSLTHLRTVPNFSRTATRKAIEYLRVRDTLRNLSHRAISSVPRPIQNWKNAFIVSTSIYSITTYYLYNSYVNKRIFYYPALSQHADGSSIETDDICKAYSDIIDNCRPTEDCYQGLFEEMNSILPSSPIANIVTIVILSNLIGGTFHIIKTTLASYKENKRHNWLMKNLEKALEIISHVNIISEINKKLANKQLSQEELIANHKLAEETGIKIDMLSRELALNTTGKTSPVYSMSRHMRDLLYASSTMVESFGNHSVSMYTNSATVYPLLMELFNLSLSFEEKQSIFYGLLSLILKGSKTAQDITLYRLDQMLHEGKLSESAKMNMLLYRSFQPRIGRTSEAADRTLSTAFAHTIRTCVQQVSMASCSETLNIAAKQLSRSPRARNRSMELVAKYTSATTRMCGFSLFFLSYAAANQALMMAGEQISIGDHEMAKRLFNDIAILREGYIANLLSIDKAMNRVIGNSKALGLEIDKDYKSSEQTRKFKEYWNAEKEIIKRQTDLEKLADSIKNAPNKRVAKSILEELTEHIILLSQQHFSATLYKFQASKYANCPNATLTSAINDIIGSQCDHETRRMLAEVAASAANDYIHMEDETYRPVEHEHSTTRDDNTQIANMIRIALESLGTPSYGSIDASRDTTKFLEEGVPRIIVKATIEDYRQPAPGLITHNTMNSFITSIKSRLESARRENS